MKQLEQLMYDVMMNGTLQSNRTGIDTIGLFGAMLTFDLTEGFPVITTRKAPWKSAIAEQMGFIRAYTSADQFRALGCNFWDANANENTDWLSNPNRSGTDDLGEIYGHQARHWRSDILAYFYDYDQLHTVLNELGTNPQSRRLLVSHWRPDRFVRMALPPCHVMYQFQVNVERNELNMLLYMRSNDLFLGAPANIVEYAWLLEMVAAYYGYTAKKLVYTVGDAHIYKNHVEQTIQQINRPPFKSPRLLFDPAIIDRRVPCSQWLESLEPDMFRLDNYQHHDAISATMAL